MKNFFKGMYDSFGFDPNGTSRAKKIIGQGFTFFFGGWILNFLSDKFKVDNKLDSIVNAIANLPSLTKDISVELAVNSNGVPYLSMLIGAVLLVLSVRNILDLINYRRKGVKISTPFYIWYVYISITAIYSILFCYTRTITYFDLVPRIENRIEIIAPYISDKEYKELRSEYYSLRTEDQMNQFKTKISKKEKTFELPLNK